jgi:hypothetical protein
MEKIVELMDYSINKLNALINKPMKKTCENCLTKNDCTMIDSCKSMGHDYCTEHKSSVDNQNIEKDKLQSFEDAARPLIKWMCENKHPMHSAIITGTSCELLESPLSSPKIFDYVTD